MEIDKINNVQASILELCGRYKFVCLSQMLPIIGKASSYVRAQLKSLQDRDYLKAFAFDKPGKSEFMYHLTEAGAAIIVEHSKVFFQPKVPMGHNVLVVRDYAHRKATVTVSIKLTMLLEAQGIPIVSYDQYFDKTGSNRNSKQLEAKTKLMLADGSFYIPDSILIAESSGVQSIYLIEMFCDLGSTRVVGQLETHLRGSAHAAPFKKFGLRTNPYILSVFQHQNVMVNVMDKIAPDSRFTPFIPYLFFCSLDELVADASTALKNIVGEQLKFTQ